MSQENVEVVRRHAEAWNRRDLRTWLASFRSDAEIDWSRARGPFGGVYPRYDGLKVFWEVWWSTFEDLEIETHGFAEAGAEVVVSNTAHARGREGIEVTARSTFVFTVENGQITAWRMVQERAEALEAVGLRAKTGALGPARESMVVQAGPAARAGQSPIGRRKRPWRGRGEELRQTVCCGASLLWGNGDCLVAGPPLVGRG